MKSIAIAVIAGALVSAAPIEIQEWTVPWENSRPRDPYVGPQGRVWFVGQRSDYVASLDPATGEFKKFDLEPGTGPHNLIVDRQGMIWYAGNRAAHIGKLDPATGQITKIPTPGVRDPHTLVFDSKGDIWFTAQGANVVGKLTVATGHVRVFPVATPNARPYGIAIDAHDRPWIVLVGTNKIATVGERTTGTGPVLYADGVPLNQGTELREIPLPRPETRPRRVAITSDGAIWYVDFAGGYLGRYDPGSGAVKEWRAPSAGQSRPYAMAVDDRDRLWFVETGVEPNQFVGFDRTTEEFFSITDIGSGAGAVRHMVFHAPTRSIWFGTDANTIGRAAIP